MLIRKLMSEGLVDIAHIGVARQSSTREPFKAACATYEHGGPIGCHTNREMDPWWELEFSQPYVLHHIVIENRRDQFQSRAASLSVSVSEDGVHWTEVYSALNLFGDLTDSSIQGPLILSLGGEIAVTGIKVQAKGITYLNLGRVYVLCSPNPVQLDQYKDRIFIAMRPDGFGARLQSIINAMRCAEHYLCDFRIYWPDFTGNTASFHAIECVEAVFSADFQSKNVILGTEPPEYLNHREIKQFNETVKAQTAGSFRVDHDLDVRHPFLNSLLSTGSSRRAFDRIGFSDRYKDAIAAADREDFKNSIAFHLRSGDIVFDRYRLTGEYSEKVTPFPIVKKAAEKLAGHNTKMCFFGESAAACNYLAQCFSGVFPTKIANEWGFSPGETALFEIAAMGHASRIFCGTSSFSRVAAQIADVHTEDAFSILEPGEIRDAFLSVLQRPVVSAWDVSELERAFSCWHALAHSRELFSTAEQMSLVDTAIQCDPTNVFYCLFRANLLALHGEESEAEDYLSGIFQFAEKDRRMSFFRLLAFRRYGRSPILRHFSSLRKLSGPYSMSVINLAEASDEAAVNGRDGFLKSGIYRSDQ